MNRILAVIPSRYSSTRFPGKPLAIVKGVPMVVRVFQRAKEVFDDVCVATDDERIYNTVTENGGVAMMTSALHKSGTDRCLEALEKYSKLYCKEFDAVVNVQGDEPFIATEQLEKIARAFDDETVDIATIVKKANSVEEVLDFNRPKVVIDNKGFALYFSRSVIPHCREVYRTCRTLTQEAVESNDFYLHIGLYGYRSGVLKKICAIEQTPLELLESLEQLRWLESGFRIKVALSDHTSYGIDTPEDLAKINAMDF